VEDDDERTRGQRLNVASGGRGKATDEDGCVSSFVIKPKETGHSQCWSGQIRPITLVSISHSYHGSHFTAEDM
jgi:hypothetical protein